MYSEASFKDATSAFGETASAHAEDGVAALPSVMGLPILGPAVGAYGNWALLSDSEMVELAERALRGMVVPELLRRLSRREIVSLLMAQQEMGAGSTSGAVGPSANAMEARQKAAARPGDVAGGGSPGRLDIGHPTSAAAPGRHWESPAPSRTASLAAPASWAGDPPYGLPPPTMPELPKPWGQEGPRFVTARLLSSPPSEKPCWLQESMDSTQAELTTALAKAQSALGWSQQLAKTSNNSESLNEHMRVVFDERAQRLMRNEDTLKQLAEGAQRLLQQAKLEGAERWEDAKMQDSFPLRRDARQSRSRTSIHLAEEGEDCMVPARDGA